MTSLLITYDDTVFFNGATAVENTDYTNYGCTKTSDILKNYKNHLTKKWFFYILKYMRISWMWVLKNSIC